MEQKTTEKLGLISTVSIFLVFLVGKVGLLISTGLDVGAFPVHHYLHFYHSIISLTFVITRKIIKSLTYTVKKASPLTAFRRFFPASGRGKSLVDNGTFFPASTAGFPAAHIGNKFRHMQNSVFRRLRTIPSPLSSFTSNRRNFPAFSYQGSQSFIRKRYSPESAGPLKPR